MRSSRTLHRRLDALCHNLVCRKQDHLAEREEVDMETQRIRSAFVRCWAAAAACMVVLVGLSCAGGPKSERAGGPPGKPDGRALFLNNCATCHGEDGRARKFHGRIVAAKDLTNAKWQQSVTDEQIASAIELGPKAMPAFKGKFSPSEMNYIVAYVRQFKPAAPAK